MNRKAVTGDALAAISLASLWFIREFRLTFYPTDHGYFERVRQHDDIFGLLIAVAVLSCIYFLLFRSVILVKKIWLARLLRIVLLLLGLAALGAPSSEAISFFDPNIKSFVNLPMPLVVLTLCVAMAYRDRFSLTAILINFRRAAFFAAPFALLLCGLAVSFVLRPEPSFAQEIERPATKDSDSRVKNRVIWIIYDEFGRAPFVDRPKDVKMPAFDRLMSESFVAENAYPPNKYTRDSIPALLTGMTLKAAKPIAADDVKLSPANGEPSVLLSKTENVVTDTKRLGGNVAIAGWYHPYTRLFSKELTAGYFRTFDHSKCQGAFGCAAQIAFYSLINVPFIARGLKLAIGVEPDPVTTKDQLSMNPYLQAAARGLAINADIDLCYFHFSIPHRPFITKTNEPARRGYYDSLEAVDTSFGELRTALEDAGLWDSTAIIVSADHWWREKDLGDFAQLPESDRQAALNDTHVPFIVKLPNQTNGQVYSPAFNTVVTRYLINAIMSGEVNTLAELSGWLDRMAVERPDLVNFRASEPAK